MANFLTIEKVLYGYYNFVVNGNVAELVKNDRNDVTGVGNLCHFKMSNGASIVKKQDIPFGNVTIIDGVTSSVPTSMDDLIAILYSVGFFDWRDGAGGTGVDRFDELEDTFPYFGKDGQGLRVNESELKLEPYVLPDVSKLNALPDVIVPGQMLIGNATADGYEFATVPAGASGYNWLFTYVSLDPQEFTLASSASLNQVLYNGSSILKKGIDWTQVGNLLTILPTVTLVGGDEITALGNF